jgi:hypothetical protein
MSDICRIGMVIFTDHFLRRFQSHGSQLGKKRGKCLRVRDGQEIKIQSIATRINPQNVFANFLVVSEGHFQGGQSFAVIVLSFLSLLKN